MTYPIQITLTGPAPEGPEGLVLLGTDSLISGTSDSSGGDVTDQDETIIGYWEPIRPTSLTP
jgi:hypothetical protein